MSATRRRIIDGQLPAGPPSEHGYCTRCNWELRAGEERYCADCKCAWKCASCGKLGPGVKPDDPMPPRLSLCSSQCKANIEAIERERARRFAKATVDGEERNAKAREMPKAMTVGERLAMDYVPEDWRVRDWQLVGQRIMLAAQWKAGKTTAVTNLASCLADGRPWLNEYEVKPPEGRIAVLDFEMADDRPGPLDEWYRRGGLQNKDAVLIYGLRGQASAFNLLDDAVAERWVEQMRQEGVGYVILDCLRPVLDALGLNEHTEAGAFLVRFDAMLEAAKIREAALVQHMGHQKADGSTAGRTRGDSRLMDWPDVSWTLEREKPNDPRSRRSLSAYGRSVDVARTWICMDAQNRLTIASGEQEQGKDEQRDEAFRDLVLGVLKVIREAGPTSQKSLKGTLGIHIRDESLASAVDWVMERKLGTKGKQRSPYRLTAAGAAFLDTKGHGKWDEQPESELFGEEQAA